MEIFRASRLEPPRKAIPNFEDSEIHSEFTRTRFGEKDISESSRTFLNTSSAFNQGGTTPTKVSLKIKRAAAFNSELTGNRKMVVSKIVAFNNSLIEGRQKDRESFNAVRTSLPSLPEKDQFMKDFLGTIDCRHKRKLSTIDRYENLRSIERKNI